MSTKNILLLLIGAVVVVGLGFAGFAVDQKAKGGESITTQTPKTQQKIAQIEVAKPTSSVASIPAVNSTANSVTTTQSSSPAQDTMAKPKVYTQEELAKGNSQSFCLTSFAGKVYDVTTYINSHPGGKAILKSCGKGLERFSDGHPGGEFSDDKMQNMLKKFEVGTI
jgi:cytochrome b involved in lipid metabolism